MPCIGFMSIPASAMASHRCSFVVSLPFCIFLGAISGIFGGRELAQDAITQLFAILPRTSCPGLAPEVEAVMGSSTSTF